MFFRRLGDPSYRQEHEEVGPCSEPCEDLQLIAHSKRELKPEFPPDGR